jgi:hypothetical protein
MPSFTMPIQTHVAHGYVTLNAVLIGVDVGQHLRVVLRA